MSDPQRLPDDHPRRAEPLQPDKPGAGRDTVPADDGIAEDDGVRKAMTQEDTALQNTREGYD